jgi:hypothetical protein
MKVGPSGSAIRSLIPSHRNLLRSKAVVVNYFSVGNSGECFGASLKTGWKRRSGAI